MKTREGTVTTATEARARFWRGLGVLGVVVASVLVGRGGRPGGSPGASPTPLPSSISCRAVEVHDGDTLTCASSERALTVRVSTIDAPELDQRYGPGAREATQKLVIGKTLELTNLDQDGYGRLLATVTLPDSSDLAEQLAARGLAWWYYEYSASATAIESAERAARTAHRGLWADPSPVAPWAWRHRSSPSPAPTASPSAATPSPEVAPSAAPSIPR